MTIQATGPRATLIQGIAVVEDVDQLCPECQGPVVRIQAAGLSPLLECVDTGSHQVPPTTARQPGQAPSTP